MQRAFWTATRRCYRIRVTEHTAPQRLPISYLCTLIMFHAVSRDRATATPCLIPVFCGQAALVAEVTEAWLSMAVQAGASKSAPRICLCHSTFRILV